MRRSFPLAFCLLLFSASLTFAQAVTSGTGAINGKVTDASDAVMPGVTVTLTSPSQMGTRATVTDSDGTYRFTAVTPGDYVVMFELAGFSTVRNEGIRVSLGFTATVNAELKVASLQESVTVTGQSPVVDTSATAIGNIFDAKQLSALPTSRDYFSLLAQSPAVQMARIDVGGSTNGTQQGFVVYGTSGQVRVIFEGLNATEATGAFGNYPDVGGMEEVQVNTAAHTAEASTPGVQSQFISKSGGNQFRGTFFGGYSPESWQAFNIDDDQIARGLQGGGGLEPEDVNRLNQYQDSNVGLGGYVIKDRLWWYGSYRHQDIRARYVNFPVKPQQTVLNNYSAKVTYNLTTNNKFVFYTQPSQKSSRSVSTHGCSASTPVSISPKPRRGTRTSGRGCTRVSGTASSATTRLPRSAAASTAMTGPTASTARASATKTPATTISTAATAIGRASGAATRCSARSACSRTGPAITTSRSAARSSTKR